MIKYSKNKMCTFFRERIYIFAEIKRMHGQLDMMDACDAIGRMKRGIQTVVPVDPASMI